MRRQRTMTANQKLLSNGWEDVPYLTDDSYDSALIAVSDQGQAVYDYDLMVRWLMERDGVSREDAVEWIDYNTIRALDYMGDRHPIVIHMLEQEDI